VHAPADGTLKTIAKLCVSGLESHKKLVASSKVGIRNVSQRSPSAGCKRNITERNLLLIEQEKRRIATEIFFLRWTKWRFHGIHSNRVFRSRSRINGMTKSDWDIDENRPTSNPVRDSCVTRRIPLSTTSSRGAKFTREGRISAFEGRDWKLGRVTAKSLQTIPQC